MGITRVIRIAIIVWSLALAACLPQKPPVVTPDPPTDAPITAPDNPTWAPQCRDLWQQELARAIDAAGLAGCLDQFRRGDTSDQVRATVRASAEWQTKHPPAAPRATEAELHRVLGNFCNLRDAQGRVIFDPFYIALPPDERKDWLDRHRAAGSTHVVLSPTIGYPGSPIPGRDLYGDPPAFVAFVRELLATPSANGKGFTPILMLDSGDPGIRERIARFWPGIRSALGADADSVIVTPGWELVNASAVTSAEYSVALTSLHDLGYPHIWAHLAPGRAAFSSHPVEADDPWQGGESEAWKSHGGQYIEGLLYQSQAVRPDDDRCDPLDADCWLNRWEDVVPRLGAGMNGWRVVHLAYFEGPAYYYYRGQSDSAFARRIATAARAMCDKYGVVCGFGNGLPAGGR
jgi:hypothetical protein